MTDVQPAVSPNAAAVDAAMGKLVESGDLDRLVSLARVVGGIEDSMSDDIVHRLAGIAADGLDLVDKVSRSGIARALPTIGAMVDNGDIERVAALARLVGGAQDAMSDEIVTRLAGIANDGLALVDRATRDDLGQRLLAMADHVESSGIPASLIEAVKTARAEVAAAPPVKGGIGGLISLMSRKETQEAMQFGMAVLNALRKAK